MAEEGQASTAQSNLLDSLPHLAWTQPFHLQGKQQLGVAGPTLIYNPIETDPFSFKPTQSSCTLQPDQNKHQLTQVAKAICPLQQYNREPAGF